MNSNCTNYRHLWLSALFCCTFVLLSASQSFSQSGCTDENACNYDSGATTDDGSCTYTGYFIPVNIGDGPAIQACSAPSGYYFPDQSCLETIVANDPYCLNTDWDSLCQEALNDCQGCEEGEDPSWYIPIVPAASGQPAVNSCSQPDGYWMPDQACVETVVSSDGYCTVTSWDNLCQSDFNSCFGCEEPSWFIPVEVGSGPAEFACSQPEGYWLPDQECVQDAIAADPFCIESSWDSLCQNAFESCIGCDDGAAWFIPINADNSLTPQFDCSGEVINGYWEPSNDCSVEVIANDSWCLDIGWDSACQSALSTCLGCADGDGAWFIPVEVGSEPAEFGCAGDAPTGFWEPDQACVTETIANDSYCLYTSWDSLCQSGYNSCAYGCTTAQWYIPSEIGANQPAVLDCSAPSGYELAESQECVIAQIALDPFCVESNWDSLCQSGYDNCTEGCTYSFACNYDPGAIYDDGSCGEAGCTDATAQNYNADAECDDGSCVYGGEPSCPGDFNDDSMVSTPDLLEFLGLFGTVCP